MAKVKAVSARGGRRPRHQGRILSKNRTFRVVPTLDAELIRIAADSHRSVSEVIEDLLTQGVHAQAYLGLLLGNRADAVARLLSLVTRAAQIANQWATDPVDNERFKTAVTALIDAVARNRLSFDDMNNGPGSIEGRMLAWVLFNPHELMARPAEPHVKLVQSD